VGTTAAAVLLGRVDLLVACVGLLLAVAIVARHVLIAADRHALERSLEAWVPAPIRRNDLESWIPPLVGTASRN
jgi:hypothetical protein